MKDTVWSTFYHVASSNQGPTHDLCSDTWCKYKQASLNGEDYDHDDHFHLDEALMGVIKPTFVDLLDPNLLSKCLHGKTQNINECLNNVIWTRIPKQTFVTLSTLKLGVADAIGCFNDGNIFCCRTLKELGVKPGDFCLKAMQQLDKRRIRDAERINKTNNKFIFKIYLIYNNY